MCAEEESYLSERYMKYIFSLITSTFELNKVEDLNQEKSAPKECGANFLKTECTKTDRKT